MRLNKTMFIASREYLTRVRKKSFIILTLLSPIILTLLFISPALISQSTTKEYSITVFDESGLFKGALGEYLGNINFVNQRYSEYLLPSENELFLSISIPGNLDSIKADIYYFSFPGQNTIQTIERAITNFQFKNKLKAHGLNDDQVEDLQKTVELNQINLSAESDDQTDPLVGFIASLVVYLLIFLYSAFVMRGVMEEKSNRIVEVLITSVKPVQLLLGKIIGMGLMIFTQLAIWSVLTALFISLSSFIVPGIVLPGEVSGLKSGIDLSFLLSSYPVFFFIFLILGYLLYSGFFAAIGAAVDQNAETQQFILPITFPLIFSIFVMPNVMESPNSAMAIFMSIFPLTSPTTMVLRLWLGVPVIELVLAIILLLATIALTLMGASKIYRIGILTHGASVNYKKIFSWLIKSEG